MDRHSIEFQEIYDAYQPKILRYLIRLVGQAEAEDLTQEAFIKAGRSIRYFRGESSLSTWLYRIATHTALDRLRSRSFQRQQAAASLSDGECGSPQFITNALTGENTPTAEKQLIRKEMDSCLLGFIAGLPENYRTILVLSELEEVANNEIAEILGVTLGTVKVRLHRAKEKLKQALLLHCDSYWVEENEFIPNLNHLL